MATAYDPMNLLPFEQWGMFKHDLVAICVDPDVPQRDLDIISSLSTQLSWSKLLCKQVGMVMAKVRASIWSGAPTALLFRAPTIRGLAQEIEAARGSAAQKTDLAIPRAPFTDAERAAGVEVLPMQADLLQSDPTHLAETQVTPQAA